MSQTTFSALKLQSALLDNIASLGYLEMTPIQAQSLPHILAGKDVIGQGKTGSGKTAAFSLGILEKLDTKSYQVQSLILCPTRELADQVAKEVRKLARTISNVKVLTLCGGTPSRHQTESLEHGTHIVVGTPGRIEEHLSKGTLKLDHLTTFVLDEADRMLDMGFQDALEAIIDYLPQRRQTLLFSATYPDKIQSIAQRVMINPLIVQVTSTHDSDSIQQYFYKVDDDASRLTALRLLLLMYRPVSAVVFCNTKQETQDVADALQEYDFSVLALHGDMEQRDRDETLVRFANKSASILVATDVAARGLDIDSIDAVINYHLAHDPEIHIHRIGRTGRAGNTGMACTLYSEKDAYKLAKLEEYLNQPLDKQPLPPHGLLSKPSYESAMTTLKIDGGKKQKLRPGDILGALTGENGIAGDHVGKIHLFDNCAYVAVNRKFAKAAQKKLFEGKLKGRSYRVRLLGR